MTHMYFSARAEGRISYGHLGRTDSCLQAFPQILGAVPTILLGTLESMGVRTSEAIM